MGRGLVLELITFLSITYRINESKIYIYYMQLCFIYGIKIVMQGLVYSGIESFETLMVVKIHATKSNIIIQHCRNYVKLSSK